MLRSIARTQDEIVQKILNDKFEISDASYLKDKYAATMTVEIFIEDEGSVKLSVSDTNNVYVYEDVLNFKWVDDNEKILIAKKLWREGGKIALSKLQDSVQSLQDTFE